MSVITAKISHFIVKVVRLLGDGVPAGWTLALPRFGQQASKNRMSEEVRSLRHVMKKGLRDKEMNARITNINLTTLRE